MTSIVVLDAGSRYGLHPTWAELRGIAEFHLFEMDTIEAERLSKKYARDDLITVHPIALHSHATTLTYSVMTHRALNSLHAPNRSLLDDRSYMIDEFAEHVQHEAQAKPVDDVFPDGGVHYFKLDVEGAEADVLAGAERTLSKDVLGVRSEVQFAEVFSGTALFGDLDRFMVERGFALLNLDYTGAGNVSGRFASPGRYGQLMTSDAVWVLPSSKCLESSGAELRNTVVRQAIFLMQNNAKDLAVELLLDARQQSKVEILGSDPGAVERFLHRKVALHMKSLIDLPMFTTAEIAEAYEAIFDVEFPRLNNFFESDMFD